MNKRVIKTMILTTALILAAAALAAGAGTQETITEDVKGVTGVVLGAPGTLYITQGAGASFSMEGPGAALSRIRTSVRDNTLLIRTSGTFTFGDSIEYYLTLPKFEEIAATSSGSILTDEIKSTELSIRASSSGNITINQLTADTLEVKITSSGDIVLIGSTEKLNATLSSSGNLQAEDLQVQEADIRISSSGDASLWVTDTLSARLNSSGNLFLFGEPEITDHRITSSGEITARGKK